METKKYPCLLSKEITDCPACREYCKEHDSFVDNLRNKEKLSYCISCGCVEQQETGKCEECGYKIL
jgi:hypothetical protein